MRRLAGSGLASAVLAAVLAGPAARGEPSSTQPAAAASASSADATAPKEAIKAFVTAQIKGDGPGIRAVLLTTNPTEERMAGAISDLAAAIAQLNQAMVAKFGAAATQQLMGDPQDALRANLDKLDRATVTVNGDTATVTSSPDTAGAPTPAGNNVATATPPASPAAGNTPPTDAGAASQESMMLKKVNGQWKVSVSDLAKGSSSENVQKTLASVDTAVAGYKSVLADLTAGKLTTVDAVGTELNQKMTANGTQPPAGAGMPGTPSATVPPVTPSK